MRADQEQMRAEMMPMMEAKLETNQEMAECIKIMHMLTALQGQVSDVLHEVLKGATYKETIKAKEGQFGDQKLATGYHDQLKSQTQDNGESPQEAVITIKQLTHHYFPALHKDHVCRGAWKAFGNSTRH
jgi:uncharacterized membrane protein YgaE (UPF0421/DUF939 family)